MTALLSLQDVRVHFGGVKAVDGVSVKLDRGLVHGLVGPNGSGKTTLLNAVSGVQHLTSGSIVLDGNDVTAHRAHQMSWAGVARTFQTIKLLPTMNVMENIKVGAEHPGPRAKRTAAKVRTRVEDAMELLEITHLSRRRPGELSYGTRRRVEIARAVASDPQLVLLDEPLAGMNRSERDGLASLIRKLADSGITQLLIEHDLRTMLSICDRLLVMNFGNLIAEGPPHEVAALPEVQRVYLGSGHGAA